MKIKNNTNMLIGLTVLGTILAIIFVVLLFLMPKNSEQKKDRPSYSSEKNVSGKEEKKKQEDKNKHIIQKQLTIDSVHLKTVVENPGIKTASLGTITAEFGEENSLDGGKFLIKESFGEIKYIVFKEKYNYQIVNGIKTTDTREEIFSKLQETYKEIDKKDINSIYITVEDERFSISFYPDVKIAVAVLKGKENPKLTNRMEEALKELEGLYSKDGKELKTVLNKFTDILPSYASYEYDQDFVKLAYPDLGIEIDATAKNETKNKINIYKDSIIYKQFEKKIEEISEKSKKYRANVRNVPKPTIEIVSGNFSSIYARKKITEHSSLFDGKFSTINTEYNVLVRKLVDNKNNQNVQKYNKLSVIFKNDKYENYNLNKTATADSIGITDKYIYYTLRQTGIFRLEPYTRQTTIFVQNIGSDRIKEVKDGIIYMESGNTYRE